MLDFEQGQIVMRNERTQPEFHGETGVILGTFESSAIVKWDEDSITTAINYELIDIVEVTFDENDHVA